MMENFRQFYEQTEEQEKNVEETLRTLPKKHQKLIKGYRIKWQCDNTLEGDNDHVGIVNPNNKTITISAPWKYGRQFTFLHELAHKVWEHFVQPYPKLVAKWSELVKKNKSRLKQNDEELFCHAYAAAYSKYPPLVHYHKDWVKFVKSIK